MRNLARITIFAIVLLSMISCTQSHKTIPSEKKDDPTQSTFTFLSIPADLPESGLCAVGVIDTSAKTAKIVTDTGLITQIPYRSNAYLIPGEIYRYTRSDDVVELAQIQFKNSSAVWKPRMYDHTDEGTADRILFHNGKRALVYQLTDDCVVFVRFSDTQYRIFKGADVIQHDGYPCCVYFNAISLPSNELSEDSNLVGYTSVILVVGDPQLDQLHANPDSSYFFDPEGFGWSDGDLIIE